MWYTVSLDRGTGSLTATTVVRSVVLVRVERLGFPFGIRRRTKPLNILRVLTRMHEGQEPSLFVCDLNHRNRHSDRAISFDDKRERELKFLVRADCDSP